MKSKVTGFKLIKEKLLKIYIQQAIASNIRVMVILSRIIYIYMIDQKFVIEGSRIFTLINTEWDKPHSIIY